MNDNNSVNELSNELKKVVLEEWKKREEIRNEADEIIRACEQHYLNKKIQSECIDIERMSVIDEIHNIVKTKDLKKLYGLIERLR